MPPRFLHPLLVRYIRGPNHPSKIRLLFFLQKWLRGIVCPLRPGILMEQDYDDVPGRELLMGHSHEPLTLALFERLLGPGDTFVDIGANVGYFSLLAAQRVGPQGRVYSLEPNPAALGKLRTNFALNPALHAEIVAAAVSDRTGEVRLVQPDPWNLGGTRIDERGSVVARCAPLPELVPALLGHPTQLVKIDVEGHEPAVLRGIFAVPGLRPRHIVFEFKPAGFPIADAESALWRPLRAAGYVVRTVEGNPLGGEIPEHNVWAEHLPTGASSK
jgi:FkbM family methyltransferase